MFGGRFVRELKPKDFNSVTTWKLKDTRCSVVLFYCPWCPHCQALKDTWKKLAKVAAFCNVLAFNCEKHKRHVLKISEDAPELIKTYPTIVVYEKGQPKEIYDGDRSLQSLVKTCMRICQ